MCIRDRWKEVVKDKTFAADKSEKAFTFEKQMVYGFKFVATPVSYTHLDVYKRQDDNLANYRIPESARALQDFVDDMINWYVRRSRERFWAKRCV